jgi:hypothetical protein
MTSPEMTDSEIVQICQNAQAIELASFQSIRGLFLTIEAVALGVAAVLISQRALGPWIAAVTVIGLVITPVWVWQVRQRWQVVDDWNQRIYDHTRKMVISKYFDNYKKTGLHWRSIRLRLDYFTPVAVAILWVVFALLGWRT